ncbi:MAG: hypothetical protein M3322_08080 [Actinomycetota bacterium]|nr:hypothetical protein [Actinomycetota bacterium]
MSMRRHLIAVLVFTAALAAPDVAVSKEISKVSVCGASGECTTYDKSDFNNLMFLADDAGPTAPPTAPAPWYRVWFTVDEREHGGGVESWTVAYVPSADTLRVRDDSGGFTWVALNPRSAAVLKRAARALPAFSKARLRGLEIEPLDTQSRDAPAPTAATPATPLQIDSGTPPWEWIAGGLLAAALALATVTSTILRRRHAEATPSRRSAISTTASDS